MCFVRGVQWDDEAWMGAQETHIMCMPLLLAAPFNSVCDVPWARNSQTCGSVARLKVKTRPACLVCKWARWGTGAPRDTFCSSQNFTNAEKGQLHSKKHEPQGTLFWPFLFLLLSCISQTIYNEKEDKGKLEKPIALFLLSPNLLATKLKVEKFGRMCVYWELKIKPSIFFSYVQHFHCFGKSEKAYANTSCEIKSV